MAVLCCEGSQVVTAETISPQNLTYLLVNPLQKKFSPLPWLYDGTNTQIMPVTSSHPLPLFCFSVYWLHFHLGARVQKAMAYPILSAKERGRSISLSHSVQRTRTESHWPGWVHLYAGQLGQGKLYSDLTCVTCPPLELGMGRLHYSILGS